jgi:hypothetical protein
MDANGKEMLVKRENASTFLVKKDFIESLNKGSYEQHLKNITELASKNISQIVGENINTNVYPVCTFKKHAIVSDDYSNFYRLHIDESKDGLKISKVEKIDDIKKYSQQEVESELESDMSEALSKSIANVNTECENKLRENLRTLITFCANGKHDGFINLRKI